LRRGAEGAEEIDHRRLEGLQCRDHARALIIRDAWGGGHGWMGVWREKKQRDARREGEKKCRVSSEQ
jgi:hypothetical protein